MKVTLRRIRNAVPCKGGWRTLLESRGVDTASMSDIQVYTLETEDFDEEFPSLDILKSNGMSHFLWVVDHVMDLDSKDYTYIKRMIAHFGSQEYIQTGIKTESLLGVYNTIVYDKYEQLPFEKQDSIMSKVLSIRKSFEIGTSDRELANLLSHYDDARLYSLFDIVLDGLTDCRISHTQFTDSLAQTIKGIFE